MIFDFTKRDDWAASGETLTGGTVSIVTPHDGILVLEAATWASGKVRAKAKAGTAGLSYLLDALAVSNAQTLEGRGLIKVVAFKQAQQKITMTPSEEKLVEVEFPADLFDPGETIDFQVFVEDSSVLDLTSISSPSGYRIQGFISGGVAGVDYQLRARAITSLQRLEAGVLVQCRAP